MKIKKVEILGVHRIHTSNGTFLRYGVDDWLEEGPNDQWMVYGGREAELETMFQKFAKVNNL